MEIQADVMLVYTAVLNLFCCFSSLSSSKGNHHEFPRL